MSRIFTFTKGTEPNTSIHFNSKIGNCPELLTFPKVSSRPRFTDTNGEFLVEVALTLFCVIVFLSFWNFDLVRNMILIKKCTEENAGFIIESQNHS